MEVERCPVQTLLNSGSTIILAHSSILPEAVGYSGTIKVICMHGDAQEVAAANVQTRDERGEWMLFVGIIPDLPLPLQLG